MVIEFIYRLRNGIRRRLSILAGRVVFSARCFGSRHVRSSYGPIFEKNISDDTFRYYILGSYGRFYSDYLSGFKTDFIFLDIGANQGLYTIIAGKNPYCSAAIAFEPVRSTYFFLEKNIFINRLGNKVSAVNAALGPASSPTTIHTKSGHSGAATLRSSALKGDYESEQIRIVGADFLEKLDGKRVVLKIDVEGFEEQVLSEIIKCRWICNVESFWIEINSNWTNYNLIKSLMSSIGFEQVFKTNGSNNFDSLYERSAK